MDLLRVRKWFHEDLQDLRNEFAAIHKTGEMYTFEIVAVLEGHSRSNELKAILFVHFGPFDITKLVDLIHDFVIHEMVHSNIFLVHLLIPLYGLLFHL